MIEVKNIYKSYNNGEYVLNDISFKLEKSTMTAIVGPSGCGKTTLLKILAGFLEPDKGNILFDGNDVTNTPIQKRGAVMVFQDYALWPHMTIYDNISYGLKLKRIPKEQIESKVYEILDIMEIDKTIVKKRYPHELSGGQQQRIALARALVVDPKIILLDEPLSSLDAKVRLKLRIEIREIQKKLNLTAVYVTHDQEEALSMSDNIIVMNNGVIMQSGSPADVYNRPQSDFVAEFLGNSNVLYGIAENNVIYLNGKPIMRYDINDGKVKIIFRADDAKLNRDENNMAVLNGTIRGKMFIGSFIRYIVKIDKQEITIDTEDITDAEDINISIPKEKIFVFKERDQKI